MSTSLLLPMSAFALAASISPGPVNIVCLSSGTHYPITKGLIFVTGATLGFIVLFLGVGAGLYSLLNAVPVLEEILRWAGILFLLYLSYQLYSTTAACRNEAPIVRRDFGRVPLCSGLILKRGWHLPPALAPTPVLMSPITYGCSPLSICLFAGYR